MLIKIEEVLLREQPDVVLVPGDTNTALAGALAAAKLHMPVGHVEAGLRSFDGRMPEEINRILVDHSSEYLFSPTKSGVGNLRKEGIPEEKIFLTGDTMVEACFQNLKLAEKESNIEHELPNEFILATLHRAENVDDYSRLKNVVDSFLKLSKTIIFPVHPRTERRLREFDLMGKLEGAEHLRLIKPSSYLDFLFLLSRSRLVLTDSGGVQKEAFFLRKPCVTLRENTEWVETVELGWNILVGTGAEKIVEGVENMLSRDLKEVENPFGDGDASKRIVDIVEDGHG
jgi:UDP-N-acetylglucosamine 2-epimerase (non-hydrolysing)